jgi:hypothetical protein
MGKDRVNEAGGLRKASGEFQVSEFQGFNVEHTTAAALKL